MLNNKSCTNEEATILDTTVHNISEDLINRFTEKEQAEILISVKDRIISYYNDNRLEHMERADEYERKIEILQGAPPSKKVMQAIREQVLEGK